MAQNGAEFDIEVVEARQLSRDGRAAIGALFDANYRQANQAYLDGSLTKLRNVAIARRGGEAAGFALGELRTIDLPRLGAQPVAMAGICCVAPEHRRQGLFGLLERRAMGASLASPPSRILSCGRMAHPVSFRTMSNNPTAIPRRDVPFTPWQQEIAETIAAAYGAPAFDRETFVCRGTGVPIGYPVLELDVAPEEWEIFRAVDRDRGDSLLGLVWMPDAPPGW